MCSFWSGVFGLFPLKSHQCRSCCRGGCSQEVGCGHQGHLNVRDEIPALLKTSAVDCKCLGLQSRSFIGSGLKCHGCPLQYAASRALWEGEKLLVRLAVIAAAPCSPPQGWAPSECGPSLGWWSRGDVKCHGFGSSRGVRYQRGTFEASWGAVTARRHPLLQACEQDYPQESPLPPRGPCQPKHDGFRAVLFVSFCC